MFGAQYLYETEKIYEDVYKGAKHSFLCDVNATSSHEGQAKLTPIKKCCENVLHIYQYIKGKMK